MNRYSFWQPIAFYMRRFLWEQPFLFSMIFLSISICIAAVSTFAGVRIASTKATEELRRLRQTASGPPAPLLLPVLDARINLQPFNSAQVVEALNDIAARTALPLQEVSFTLEDNISLPYLRYRTTLTVVGKYLTIRRLIDSLYSDLPDVSFDSISCGREMLDVDPVKCDLVFSAFYAKGERG